MNAAWLGGVLALAACSSQGASIVDGTWSTTREVEGSGGCDPDPQTTQTYDLDISDNVTEVDAKTVTWIGSDALPASDVVATDGCFAHEDGNCGVSFNSLEHWAINGGVADFPVRYILNLTPPRATSPPRDLVGMASANFNDAAGFCEISWKVVAIQD